MIRLKNYIISNLSILFISIFLPLFAIASIIFSIKLATFTAVIKLSLLDMLQLYIFVIPDMLFYTLPISFFIAASLSLFKMSNDNEMIVIFSLGISPNFILKTLLKPAILLTILLSFNFFFLLPYVKILSINFIEYKKSEAKFNLSASEFGHSFGKWLLYVGKKNEDNTMENIFLFNKTEKEEILISAKYAEIINVNNILRLKLTNGEGYNYSKDEFSHIDFQAMYIDDKLNSRLKDNKFSIDYWLELKENKGRLRAFVMDTLVSLFPPIAIFLISSIGIVHTRHSKSQIYLLMFLGIIIYFTLTLGLIGVFGIYTIPIVSIFWLISTYVMYKRVIINRY